MTLEHRDNQYGIPTCRHGAWMLRDDRHCPDCDRARIDDLLFGDGADRALLEAVATLGEARQWSAPRLHAICTRLFEP